MGSGDDHGAAASGGAALTRRSVLRSSMPVLVALVVPVLSVMLLRGSRFDHVFQDVHFHLVVVSGLAACALVVAVGLAVAARSARASLQPLLIGCLGVSVFMLAHGLVTPGVMGQPANLWVARFPLLAILVFAAGLGMVHRRRTTERPRSRTVAPVLVGGLALAVPAAVLVVDPTLLSGASPVPGEEIVSDVVSVVSGIVLLATGATHWRRWRLSGSRIQLALTLAAWLSAAALVSLRLGTLWAISWWDYHAFLLAGFGAAAAAVVFSGREEQQIADVLDDVFDADPYTHIVAGYPEALEALVSAVEAKDHYTYGHSVRVAELSVRLALRLGLAPERLRSLARGAYLHDVGKIGIPDEILNKPGRLDEQERAWIERHPETGAEMVARSPSLRETGDVVRHHHERYDGTGYPDGLAGDEIPLSARICSVADVWDALTSDRAYRDAMPPRAALGHIVAARGSQFDPSAVEALVAHLAESGLVPASDGDPEIADLASEACHSTSSVVGSGTTV